MVLEVFARVVLSCFFISLGFGMYHVMLYKKPTRKISMLPVYLDWFSLLLGVSLSLYMVTIKLLFVVEIPKDLFVSSALVSMLIIPSFGIYRCTYSGDNFRLITRLTPYIQAYYAVCQSWFLVLLVYQMSKYFCL